MSNRRDFLRKALVGAAAIGLPGALSNKALATDFVLSPSSRRFFLSIRTYLFAILFFANVSMSFAQRNDWGLWTNIGVEKELSKSWDLSVGIEHRGKVNLSATEQIRGSVSISRNLGKYFKLGTGYGLIANKKARNIFEYRNRIHLQATGSYKYARLTTSWRSRVQLTIMETDDGEPRGNIFEDDRYKWIWRNRFGLKYDIKGLPLKPYINIELFNQLFSDLGSAGYYQNRFNVGFEYILGNHHTFDVGYFLQNEIDSSKKDNFIRLGYTFSF